jgi:cytochrome oxidase Cu insertion factor (SCO1/SenC/PrrC family)
MSANPRQAGAVFLFGVLLLAALACGAAPRQAAALDVGHKAPDFTLTSTTGGTISLGQFRGKKLVLLEFYGADFSPV